MRTTIMATDSNVERKWTVIDAEGATLGRLSSEVATLLRGKHKRTYTTQFNNAEHVSIVKAEKAEVTGNKLTEKKYYRHSGYTGGLKERSANEMRNHYSENMVELTVKGMLPKGPLGRQMLKKLHVYRGPEHKNQAQKPEAYELKG